ncbi:MAG TPA: polyphosphate polymerase domain-containing protein [Marmoricola sp.]|nr:polyphosphate polymerase domain-containing protein [Marmoricola sp.]HNJ77801.1 polyphosphate polymerase domain-containing protein [Marmoricola sp.]
MPRSTATVRSVVGAASPITLQEVLAVAALQTRVDRKYLLTPEEFTCLASSLDGRFRALEIAGSRLHGYESVYFDTQDLSLFRAHKQGRRKRYKVRTRTYTDTEQCLFEIKMEGPRGLTIKERMDYPMAHRGHLDQQANQFLSDHLRKYDRLETPELSPSLTTSYSRATLVDSLEGARLTIDVGLGFESRAERRRGPDRILVESKSAGLAVADRLLAAQGVRPISASKYCLGVALCHPTQSANKWNRLLRREFGWLREH